MSEPFCADCPDHEFCSQHGLSMGCDWVKEQDRAHQARTALRDLKVLAESAMEYDTGYEWVTMTKMVPADKVLSLVALIEEDYYGRQKY